MEVKAEMFDAKLNANVVPAPNVVNEHVSQPNIGKDFDSAELKNMFSAIQPSFNEYASEVPGSVPPRASTPTLVDPTKLPASFEGRVGDETIKVMEKINKTNYGDMMKAMGITT
jgi:hypothetical protein